MKCLSVSVGRFREQVINPPSRLALATDVGQQARKLMFDLFRLPDQLWYGIELEPGTGTSSGHS